MNPPAGGQDPLVRLTSHAADELVAALAGEDEVGVRVDESRQDRPVLTVEIRQFEELTREFGKAAGPGHLSPSDRHRRIRNYAEEIPAGRVVGHEMPYPSEEQVSAHDSSMGIRTPRSPATSRARS